MFRSVCVCTIKEKEGMTWRMQGGYMGGVGRKKGKGKNDVIII